MAAATTIRNDFTLGFQIKYCLVIVTSLTASNLFLYYNYLQHGLGKSYFEALVTLSHVGEALAAGLLMTFVLQCLLIFFCSLILLHFFSRKIAGLIYRFEHLLRGIGSGDLQHVVKNRDHDQIKALFSALNCLLTSLRTVYSSVQGVERNLHKVIRQLGNGEIPDRQSLRQQIAQTRILLGCRNAREGD